MTHPSQLLFLPGASGNTAFWQAAARRLRHPATQRHFGWPGFGDTPPDPDIHGLEDLAERVIAAIDRPTALIAQSMGGAIALLAASRRPEWVTHLVLTVTSGGIDISDLGAQDWRPAFGAAHPELPRWFLESRLDLTPVLATIQAPALLLWGDADPISPVAVGRRLAAALPQARMHVFAGGDHDLGDVLASEVAPLIDAHLGSAGNARECAPPR